MNPGRYQAPTRASNANTLLPILHRQAQQNRITLNEMYIGDQGAYILADFLKEHPDVGLIDLKGNNIGPDGFVYLFEVLKNNRVI